jgi:hypothetical protein
MTTVSVEKSLWKVEVFIKDLPEEVARMTALEAAKFFIEKLRPYAEYKYVSRKSAYPNSGSVYPDRWMDKKGRAHRPIPGYFSLAQYQFVMIGIAEGRITPGVPQRTNAIANAWGQRANGKMGAMMYNYSPGVKWVEKDGWQANQIRMVGHKTAYTTLSENASEAQKYLADFIQNSLEDIWKRSIT